MTAAEPTTQSPTLASSGESDAAPRRALIILLGAIGDVVRALPLLGRIRRAWPAAHLAWAVEPKAQAVLEGHPWLDELIVYDRRRAPWSFMPFLVRVRAGNFDLALDLQRHLKSGVVSIASGARVRVGFDRSNVKEFNHLFSTRRIAPQPPMRLKLMQYQGFGDALGIAPAPVEFGLAGSAAEHARATTLLEGAPRPLLAVILGSSWPSRIYFPDSIAAVIREMAIARDGCPALYPVLIGSGRDEVSLAEQVVANLAGGPALNLTGRTGLRDLIAIFAECAAAFGPDSGPMHIAAAAGCPVVSLWGATAPERSAPWGFGDLALSGGIPCHPCYLRECPIGRECMRRIAPADVAAAIRRGVAAPRVTRALAADPSHLMPPASEAGGAITPARQSQVRP
ncbi:MAG TPA: glycosyltransferase family 9 protein [Candidatus Binataceae bacterium]|jgi:heptosyltransferase-1|nr:glycosyltransferase family 9 protein [Candidatus Binataceae bacterium]